LSSPKDFTFIATPILPPMNTLKKFSSFCNANKGIIELTGVLIALTAFIQSNSSNIHLGRWWESTILLLIYNVAIPIYVLLILVIGGVLYFIQTKRRYKLSKINFSILIGIWKNEWTIDGVTRSEVLEIKNDSKYFLGSTHKFNIEDFNYDVNTNEITFKKTSVIATDNRTLFNRVSVINNDTLIGSETDYKIKYTRIN